MKNKIEWVEIADFNNDAFTRSIIEQKLINVGKILEKFKSVNIVREAKVADYEIRGNQHMAIAINVNDPKDVHWFDIDPGVNNDAFIRACGWAYEPEDLPDDPHYSQYLKRQQAHESGEQQKISIIVEVEVTKGTDLNVLKQRVTEQINKISNPVRDDQGILNVSEVWWASGFLSDREKKIGPLYPNKCEEITCQAQKKFLKPKETLQIGQNVN